jgi:hypothetical protein
MISYDAATRLLWSSAPSRRERRSAVAVGRRLALGLGLGYTLRAADEVPA